MSRDRTLSSSLVEARSSLCYRVSTVQSLSSDLDIAHQQLESARLFASHQQARIDELELASSPPPPPPLPQHIDTEMAGRWPQDSPLSSQLFPLPAASTEELNPWAAALEEGTSSSSAREEEAYGSEGMGMDFGADDGDDGWADERSIDADMHEPVSLKRSVVERAREEEEERTSWFELPRFRCSLLCLEPWFSDRSIHELSAHVRNLRTSFELSVYLHSNPSNPPITQQPSLRSHPPPPRFPTSLPLCANIILIPSIKPAFSKRNARSVMSL